MRLVPLAACCWGSEIPPTAAVGTDLAASLDNRTIRDGCYRQHRCFCHPHPSPPTRVESVSSSAILDETFLLANRRLRILMRPLCLKILDFPKQK